MTDDELQGIVRYEVSKIVPHIVSQVARQVMETNKTIHSQFVAASAAILDLQNKVVDSVASVGTEKTNGKPEPRFTTTPKA